jgi:hypothetical protein
METAYVWKCTAAIVACLALAGCTREPGEGGNGQIKGTLYCKSVFDKTTAINPEEYLPEEKVYISYGEKDTYDEDVRTSGDGTFRFSNLRKGKYRVLAYSLDTISHNLIPVTRTVELKSNSDVVDIKDLLIHRMPNEDGSSMISGQVKVKTYDQAGTYLGEAYLADQDVFLAAEDGTLIDRVQTGYEGNYSFTKLLNGKYIVYALSENIESNVPDELAVSSRIAVDKKNQQLSAGEFIVNRVIEAE